MAMDIWRRDDIRNALAAAQLAHEYPLLYDGDPIALAFDAGYFKALRVIGANFGIQVDVASPANSELRKLLASPAKPNGR